MTLDEIIKKTQSDGTWITDMEKQGAYTTTAATYMKMLQEMPVIGDTSILIDL